jgi:hypothetical protein
MHRYILLLFCCLAACSGPSRLPAVPAALTDQATVLGIPNARFWADTDGPAMLQEAIRARSRENDPQAAADFLALSGGSDNGAFGAGVLAGWTELGTRPPFKLVTGVSTGSLIAPFAFLGPAYDPQLRAVYTEITPDDVFESRGLLSAVFHDALTSTDPLFRLISHYANEDMMAAIAAEYRKGRLLLIGTTNLDVQRPVIWNIGAIAASGKPEALDLFRRILLASASVPGVFPPVMIDVEAGGQQYQEMHVDGGAVAQTFLIPAPIGALADLRSKEHARQRTAWVIRNARLDPDWASVDRRLLSIASRSIGTMIHYSGYNDVVRIYFTSQRDGVDYRLGYIGADFNVPHEQNFDPTYMRALFEYGYNAAKKGNVWHNTPPIFSQPDGSEDLRR